VNLPVMILAPQAWRSLGANASRSGDRPIWYVFVLAGHRCRSEPAHLDVVRLGVLSASPADNPGPAPAAFGATPSGGRRVLITNRLAAAVRALVAAAADSGPATMAGDTDLQRRGADLLLPRSGSTWRIPDPGQQRPDRLYWLAVL
jgi:hypothetical protein